MKLFDFGLRYKILSLLLASILTCTIIITFSTYKKLKDDIYLKNQEVFHTFVNTFISEKDVIIKKFSMSLDILLENKHLINAFKERDRDTLKILVTDLYNSRLKHLYNIEQFQFHIPPATSFYRAHAPTKYNDDLSAFRKTVLLANRDKIMITGLEVGRAGLGLRVVKPVWSNYDFLGTVELGGNIETLLNTPSNSTGVEYAVGVFTKSLQRSKFFYQEEHRYTYKNMYLYNYSSNVIKSLITTGRMDNEKSIIKSGDSYFMVKNVPLRDFSSDQIGYLLLARDTTSEVIAMQKELTKQISIIVLFAIAITLLLTYVLIKMIFDPLDKITRHISSVKIDSAVPSEPIEIKGKSEITMLADAYNILSSKLYESFEKINNQIQEIQIINTSLENRVQQRTEQLEETNTRLKAAMTEIQLANEAKSEFLASMSHEIRTPMNAVLGLSYLLMQTELSSKQYDYVSKVRSSANMLLEILNDILDFSKIEAGKLELEDAPFDIKTMIDQIASMLEVSVSRKKIQIVTNIDQRIPQFVTGDQLRISQVINNLTTNASKFTNEGRIEISAQLATSNENYAKIMISVEDTGIGIPSDKLPTLFDSFTQVNNKNGNKNIGSGLGLSICKKILDAMNSEITVESKEGEGSTFIFFLTLPISEDADIKEKQKEEANFMGKRILVCEHDSDTPFSTSGFLRENLADVLSVSNQFDLLKQINNNMDCQDALSFSLIIIDTRTVGMDTFDTIQTVISSSDRTVFPPMIILSNDTEISSEISTKLPDIRLFTVSISNRDKEIPALINDLLTCSENLTPDVECFKRNRMSESGIKVLIVDDNEINLQVLTEFADILGLSYKTARNGLEAINVFTEEAFDIIFMDLIMPEMDGLTATEQIRKTKKGQSVPIYALTASTMPSDIEKCRKIGMNGHIAKPVKLQDLTMVIKECSNGHVAHLPEPETTDAVIPEKDEILDTETALNYLNGNKKLYIKLLNNFYSEYSGLDIKAKEILENGDTDKKMAFFHTIKGVTKTIGAIYLSTQCEVLERMAKNNNNLMDSQSFQLFMRGAEELDKKLGDFFRNTSD